MAILVIRLGTWLAVILGLCAWAQGAVPPQDSVVSPRAGPLFVENLGQWGASMRSVGRVGAMDFAAEAGALNVGLAQVGTGGHAQSLRFAFKNSSPQVSVEGERPREARFSYFLGNDPARWVRGARSFEAVRWSGLYEGIDLLLRAEGEVPEYDLELQPGADLTLFEVEVGGADSIEIDAEGNLCIEAGAEVLLQPLPRAFQVAESGERRELACRYRLLGEMRFGIEVDGADPERSLVVDPELVWSTYIGSKSGIGADVARAVTVGSGGDAFVAGQTESWTFPITTNAKAFDVYDGGDIFVARFRATDGALLYSTVIGATTGGSHWQERPTGIATDQQGIVTVAGWTDGGNFPTTPGALQTQSAGSREGFVIRLSPDGEVLVYSTLLGVQGYDDIEALALAASGAAVVGGRPSPSGGFPTTPGAWQTSYNGGLTTGFVARLDPTGSFLEWSTLLDGRVFGVALDAEERVVVAGNAGYNFPVTPGSWAPGSKGVLALRFDHTASTLEWATVFGTTSSESIGVTALGLDAFGNPVITGYTFVYDFPTTPGALQTAAGPGFNGILVRLHSSGGFPIYSTYFGAGANAAGGDMDVDASGVATVVGSAGSEFPTTPGAYQTTQSFNGDVLIARFNPQGDALLYATFVGGVGTEDGWGIAEGPDRRVTFAGYSNGDYPTTPGSAFPSYIGGVSDAVVTTFDLVLQGLELAWESTPACLGPIHANGTSMPRAGSKRFSFFASGAPPLAGGWLVVGQTSQTPIQLGVVMLGVQPTTRIPLAADHQGWVETPYSLESYAPGDTFAVQYLFRNPASCLGPQPWSTSNAVEVTVQQ